MARQTINSIIHSLGDLARVQIDSTGIKASTTDDGPMVPLDRLKYPNRHERRKAAALERRHLRAIGADW